MGRARLDNNSQADTGFFTISDGPHAIEIELVRRPTRTRSTAGSSCGSTASPVSTLTGLDNSLQRGGLRAPGRAQREGRAPTARIYWDEFESRRGVVHRPAALTPPNPLPLAARPGVSIGPRMRRPCRCRMALRRRSARLGPGSARRRVPGQHLHHRFAGRPRGGHRRHGSFVVVWRGTGHDLDTAGVSRAVTTHRARRSTPGIPGERVHHQRSGPARVVACVTAPSRSSGQTVTRTVSSASSRDVRPGGSGSAEFRVNTYTTRPAARRRRAPTRAGNFVVVWEHGQDGSGDGSCAAVRRLGCAAGPESGSTPTPRPQGAPDVARDPSGSFVVVWQGFTTDGATTCSRSATTLRGPRGAASSASIGTTPRQSFLDRAVRPPRRRLRRGLDGLRQRPAATRRLRAALRRRRRSRGRRVPGELAHHRVPGTGRRSLRMVRQLRGRRGRAVNRMAISTASFGQRLRRRSACQPAREFRLNTYTTSSQLSPAVGARRRRQVRRHLGERRAGRERLGSSASASGRPDLPGRLRDGTSPPGRRT